MRITHVAIENFRALESVKIPLKQFSVLIGENDVGKTSFLYALEIYFKGKPLTEITDWYKDDTTKPICITVTFGDLPDEEELTKFTREDDSIILRKIFVIGKKPEAVCILDDKSEEKISKPVMDNWFSLDKFHFIPVHRDLTLQFSMAKTALLGSILRAKMKKMLGEESVSNSLSEIVKTLKKAIEEPKEALQEYLREQMHNDLFKLEFADLEIDPIEGVKFITKLSDGKMPNVPLKNRGAGTQNNLIIALFRMIADMSLEGHFIFAMEEPENSLHPKAQRQLLSVIQKMSKTNQVIVTTHSPVFIDRSNYENNVLLTRTAKGGTVAKAFNASMLNEVRTDLGIRASDALLKGGGNCAILVEGRTEEDGFPMFMDMLGMSEFELGIAIINMGGCDWKRASNIVKLLKAYDIPCVVVLDKNAEEDAKALEKMITSREPLTNLKHVFCLKKGNIEDYYPLEIVAEVINQNLLPDKPNKPIIATDFDANKHGKERLDNFKEVMREHGAGESIGHLKSYIGGMGTEMMRDQGKSVDKEIADILHAVKKIAEQ